MPAPFQIGGSIGAIPVSATLPYTVPDGFVIYSIVPQPSWTGKAIGLSAKGYGHLTADRTETGAAVEARTAAIHSAFTSITTTAGVADVYIRPANEV
jgi:hypothetical protein